MRVLTLTVCLPAADRGEETLADAEWAVRQVLRGVLACDTVEAAAELLDAESAAPSRMLVEAVAVHASDAEDEQHVIGALLRLDGADCVQTHGEPLTMLA